MVKNRLGSILFVKEESAGLEFLWNKFVHPKSLYYVWRGFKFSNSKSRKKINNYHINSSTDWIKF